MVGLACVKDATDRILASYPAKRKHGVVGGNFLRSPMASAAVGKEDGDACHQGEAGHAKDKYLWPCIGAFRPRRHAALIWEGLGGVEDGEGSREHGHNDERTAKVDTTKSHLS